MKKYLALIEDVLENGEDHTDRTGVGTKSVFGRSIRFNLQNGFPIITTKKIPFKAVSSELLWFLEGSSDERRLAEILYQEPRENLINKTTIWTANALSDYWKPLAEFVGDLGKIYGVQWRYWKAKKIVNTGVGDSNKPFEITVFIDQVRNAIESIKKDPYSRRHIVTAYNPADIDRMALPPCHMFFQFWVSKNGKLSCQWYQRSADLFLGVPFNITSYALMTHMIAQVCGLEVGELVGTFGDLHIYNNHIDQVKLQLSREPLQLPKIKLDPRINDIDSFTMDSFKLIGYKYHPSIKAEMAV